MARKAKSVTQDSRVLFARIPAEQMKQLKRLAVEREVSVADLVHEALDRFLNKEVRHGKS
jgi:hypothetical protein